MTIYKDAIGGDHQTATFIVAASDSLHPERADYVCDGTDDQIQIQAANDVISTDGKVLLLEGTYNCTSIDIDVCVEGLGNGTIINLTTDGSTLNINKTGKLRNLKVIVSNTYTGIAVIVEGCQGGTRHGIDVLDKLTIWHEGSGIDVIQGTGLLIRAISTTTYINVALSSFGTIYIHGFEYGVKLYTTETVEHGYINGNTFESVILESNKYMLTLEAVGTAQCYGNIFNGIEMQPSSDTIDGIHLIGDCDFNQFQSIIAWDWNLASGDALIINSGASYNYAKGWLKEGYVDNGNRNDIQSVYVEIEHVVIVKKMGGHYTKLSDALNFVAGQSPAADKRFTVYVIGEIVDNTANFSPLSYTDVIGIGAHIELTVPNGRTIYLENKTSLQWRDLTFTKTGVATSYGAVISVLDCDDTVHFNNCKFFNETTGNGSQSGLNMSTGNPVSGTEFENCHFKGGNGGSWCAGVYIDINSSHFTKFINCTSEGGSGGTPCDGWSLKVGSPYLKGCIGKTGDSQTQSYAFSIGRDSAPELIDCSNELYKQPAKWSYDDADNGRFRPFSDHPYQLVMAYVQVVTAYPGETIDLGTIIGGNEIASSISIGATGQTIFELNKVELAANGYLYTTPSVPINDGDIIIQYVVVKNYANNHAIYLDTKGHAIISGGNYVSNSASDACYINQTTTKNWEMNNCHLETLDITNQHALNASGAITDVPIRGCTLIGGINNITSFVDDTYRAQSDLFMDVLAISTTYIRSNEDLSIATPITFILDAQPDVPRTLSWAFDSHAQITEYDMEVIGVDAKGNTVTETWDETAGWSGETSNAFATITSIKMTSRTGTGAGDTMDIGITDVLGLSNVIYAASDVFKIKKNNANATVAGAQVNTTYDTYDMSVITLGAADDFTIWYKSNLNIIS